MISSVALLALSTVTLSTYPLTSTPPPQNYSQAAPLTQVCTDAPDHYYCSQDNLYIEYAHQRLEMESPTRAVASANIDIPTNPISTPTPTTQPDSEPDNIPSPTPEPTHLAIEETEPEPIPEKAETTETSQEQIDTPTNTGLNSEVIFSMINQHRANLGLPAYEKHPDLCTIAQSRAPEIESEIWSGTVHAGLRTKDFNYHITENMIHKPTEQAAFNWWMNSSLHRTAIESSRHTHSCGVCVGNTCAQLFTSFIPK